jgi:hypothetical protein
MFNVVFAALILLDVANCSQASWKIDKFATWRQSTVFDMSPIQTIYWERERERERDNLLKEREGKRGGEKERYQLCGNFMAACGTDVQNVLQERPKITWHNAWCLIYIRGL